MRGGLGHSTSTAAAAARGASRHGTHRRGRRASALSHGRNQRHWPRTRHRVPGFSFPREGGEGVPLKRGTAVAAAGRRGAAATTPKVGNIRGDLRPWPTSLGGRGGAELNGCGHLTGGRVCTGVHQQHAGWRPPPPPSPARPTRRRRRCRPPVGGHGGGAGGACGRPLSPQCQVPQFLNARAGGSRLPAEG